jgi:hypothetical protein
MLGIMMLHLFPQPLYDSRKGLLFAFSGLLVKHKNSEREERNLAYERFSCYTQSTISKKILIRIEIFRLLLYRYIGLLVFAYLSCIRLVGECGFILARS